MTKARNTYKDKKNDDLFSEGQMSEERNVAYPTETPELLSSSSSLRKSVSVCFQNLPLNGNSPSSLMRMPPILRPH